MRIHLGASLKGHYSSLGSLGKPGDRRNVSCQILLEQPAPLIRANTQPFELPLTKSSLTSTLLHAMLVRELVAPLRTAPALRFLRPPANPFLSTPCTLPFSVYS